VESRVSYVKFERPSGSIANYTKLATIMLDVVLSDLDDSQGLLLSFSLRIVPVHCIIYQVFLVSLRNYLGT
jgi:hypothetical protein